MHHSESKVIIQRLIFLLEPKRTILSRIITHSVSICPYGVFVSMSSLMRNNCLIRVWLHSKGDEHN